jgi:thiamine kinase-like enzyme/GTP:adenosylcobinamide-phosphate guanylyltransferase
MKTAVLLAAGLGTRMGKYSRVINKVLLPVDGKAIISHIVDQFPADFEFIVAVGYLGELVREYLTLAHPGRKFTFVDVPNYAGPNSGPAESLRACKVHLDRPFVAVACDALYGIKKFREDVDWIGVSPVSVDDSPAYCNVSVDSGWKTGPANEECDIVIGIADKQYCDSGMAFNGIWYVKSFESFWEGLEGGEVSSGLDKLCLIANHMEWTDLGTIEKYQAHLLRDGDYDFTKVDEFLYILNGRVIKFFKDESIITKRIEKANHNPTVFPKIVGVKKNFYAYDFVRGSTLYEKNNTRIFSDFTEWMTENVWAKPATGQLTPEMCESFYKDKTFKRLEMFRQMYPDFNPTHVNGKKIPHTMEELLAVFDWDRICREDLDYRSVFIHGDLQFDNVLYDGSSFTLIDWRQDFAGETRFGDLCYDLAKLKGGIIINYDLIKQNQFTFEEKDKTVFFDFARRFSHNAYIEILASATGAYPRIVDEICSLIFLNMAPLHAAPFDKMLFSLALFKLTYGSI